MHRLPQLGMVERHDDEPMSGDVPVQPVEHVLPFRFRRRRALVGEHRDPHQLAGVHREHPADEGCEPGKHKNQLL